EVVNSRRILPGSWDNVRNTSGDELRAGCWIEDGAVVGACIKNRLSIAGRRAVGASAGSSYRVATCQGCVRQRRRRQTEQLSEVALPHQASWDRLEAFVLWLFLAQRLVVAKDKELVLPDGSAGGETKLLALKGRNSTGRTKII